MTCCFRSSRNCTRTQARSRRRCATPRPKRSPGRVARTPRRAISCSPRSCRITPCRLRGRACRRHGSGATSRARVCRATRTHPGYLVPQEWTDILDRMALHGIRMRRLARAWSDTVEMTRILDHTGSAEAYEGRHNVPAAVTRIERQVRTFRPGDVWVPTDQRGGDLVVNLLEAQAPDGFIAWGFFETVFQKKEYGGDYVVEPLARAMLARDPALAAEFKAKVAADTAFAKDPVARTDWFYRKSPWNDPEQDLHPIARAVRPVPEASLVPVPGSTPAPASSKR